MKRELKVELSRLFATQFTAKFDAPAPWSRHEGRADLGLADVAARAYQLAVSPLLGQSCRFYPTCSNYAMEAIREHGPLKGVMLAAVRLGNAIRGIRAATTRCRKKTAVGQAT